MVAVPGFESVHDRGCWDLASGARGGAAPEFDEAPRGRDSGRGATKITGSLDLGDDSSGGPGRFEFPMERALLTMENSASDSIRKVGTLMVLIAV